MRLGVARDIVRCCLTLLVGTVGIPIGGCGEIIAGLLIADAINVSGKRQAAALRESATIDTNSRAPAEPTRHASAGAPRNSGALLTYLATWMPHEAEGLFSVYPTMVDFVGAGPQDSFCISYDRILEVSSIDRELPSESDELILRTDRGTVQVSFANPFGVRVLDWDIHERVLQAKQSKS